MPKNTQRQSQQNSPELTYQKIFETAELPFAAYCRVRYQLHLVDFRRSESGKVTWALSLLDKDESVLFQEFHQGASVAAKAYFMELRSLKSMTYK